MSSPVGTLIETVHGVLDDAKNPEALLLRIGYEWRHLPEERQALMDLVGQVVQIIDSSYQNADSALALASADLSTVARDIQRKALTLYLHYREGRGHLEVLAQVWDQTRSRDPLGEVEPVLDLWEAEPLRRWLRLQFAGLVEGLGMLHSMGETTVRFFMEMAGRPYLTDLDKGLVMDMGHLFSDRCGALLFLPLHNVMRLAAELARRLADKDPPFLWSPPWQTDLRIGHQIPKLPTY